MHLLAHLVVVLSAMGAIVGAQAETAAMACGRKEAIALRDAPLGASRASTHRLDVKWSHGVSSFRDSRGFDGDLDGIGYGYCGYVSYPGFHLISKNDNGVFTGVLLNHATGKILPAGKAVVFAPDKRYFASVQPDGLDGEEWYVFSQTGVRQWKGLSGISAKHPTLKYDYFIATLEEPHWSASGELQATLKCSQGKRPPTLATLTHKDGQWTWQPTVACPPAT